MASKGAPMELVASVVIPVRNGGNWIAGQLGALARQTFAGRFEVIVSDNGSTDDTVPMVVQWEHRFARLTVVDSSIRPGVSTARNVGARAAATAKLLFCDADDVAAPGWVEAMSAGLDRFDLVGGVLRTDVLNSERLRRWGEPDTHDRLPVALRYLPYAVGANIGVKTAVMNSLDGFDTAFVGGHEEVDFAWRAQQAGHTLGHIPDAIIDYRLRGDIRGLYRQRRASGRTSAQLQARYLATGAMPPFSVAHDVRILLEHLTEGRALLDARQRGAWIGGLGWAVGRVKGTAAAGAPLRGPRP